MLLFYRNPNLLRRLVWQTLGIICGETRAVWQNFKRLAKTGLYSEPPLFMTATVPNLTSQYEPTATESKWQQAWEDNQVFKADPSQGGEPYSIMIPPPNVTGSLHMGHAFESALIDVLVRYHRMVGRNTLWLPGTDHASIAVHSILENSSRMKVAAGMTSPVKSLWSALGNGKRNPAAIL